MPDLCLPVPGVRTDSGVWNGLYLELKAPKGTLSSTQCWWLERLAELGYYTAVAKSLEEAIAVLEGYLGLEECLNSAVG